MNDYRFDNTSRAISRLLEGKSSCTAPAGAPAEDRLPRLRHQPCPLTGGNSNGHTHTDYPGNKENPEWLASDTPDLSDLLGNGRWAKARLPLHKDSISAEKFKIIGRRLMLTASLAVLPVTAFAAFTGGVVYDPQRYVQENLTLENNRQSDEQKKTENYYKSGVHCNLSGKEKAQNMRRSPSQAMSEEAHNVSLVRHYANQYKVSEALALAVAYHESRLDTCAGSPTGVKGVMQLTKRTGRSMGLDRDINEENIKGGVQYLAGIVNNCGDTNYACIARRYNGASSGEQAQWANGVARASPYFAKAIGSNQVPEPVDPSNALAKPPDYGSSGDIGSYLTRKYDAFSDVYQYFSESEKTIVNRRDAQQLTGEATGQQTRTQDGMEDNSHARQATGVVFNDVIEARTAYNKLQAIKLQENVQRKSAIIRFLDGPPSKSNPWE